MHKFCWSIALAVAPLIVAQPAFAQDYPTRPIQMIVPFTAGNVIDVLARAFAHELSVELKQPITINNISGASGILAVNAAANAKPDGYTLLFAPQGQLTIQPHLKKDLGYNFDTFKPICQVFDNVFAIIVSPKSPIRSFQDLVDRARARPGVLTWATSGTATVSDLQMSALIDKLGLKLVHVPYRNYGQMIQDTAGGNFDFAVSSVGSFSADTVHMVVLLADKRVPLFPDLVTIARARLPGLAAGLRRPLCAGQSTPGGARQPERGLSENLCAAGIAADDEEGGRHPGVSAGRQIHRAIDRGQQAEGPADQGHGARQGAAVRQVGGFSS